MIRIERLSKHYGSLKVLDNISTEIHRGEVISIIGPSGTGKSTFLRCLNLLEHPTSGSISMECLKMWQAIVFPKPASRKASTAGNRTRA